jgi:hypothetical protein
MEEKTAGTLYKIHSWETHFSKAVRDLKQQVGEALLQCERFSWIAEEIRDEVATKTVAEWEEILLHPESRTSSRERAVIALALSGQAEAGMILDAWEPPASPARLRLLWHVAKVEWENRAKGYDEEIEEIAQENDDDHDDAA